MKPLKVFIGNINYKSEFRTFLVDLLKPIIPEVNLIKYQLTISPVELIQNYSESECILLPFSWNYYVKTNTVYVARELIDLARVANKKILNTANNIAAVSFFLLIVFCVFCINLVYSLFVKWQTKLA